MAASAPIRVAAPPVVDLPVVVQLGGVEVHLGRITVDVPPRHGQIAATVANLFRTAAATIAGADRHEWPRQAWHVHDSVPLPGSVARGTVVQVDAANKRYIVDTGRGLVPVLWSAVDTSAARASFVPATIDAAVASVLAHNAVKAK